ncbi:MAG: hypothetical protein LC794_02115 [Acidobacteria bacterium]|nr:hypothetical protein [Acidobacteriota bacterium]
MTVIEVVAVVVPPGPVAVSVYVESVVGETTRLPVVMVVPELPGKVWTKLLPTITIELAYRT